MQLCLPDKKYLSTVLVAVVPVVDVPVVSAPVVAVLVVNGPVDTIPVVDYSCRCLPETMRTTMMMMMKTMTMLIIMLMMTMTLSKMLAPCLDLPEVSCLDLLKALLYVRREGVNARGNGDAVIYVQLIRWRRGSGKEVYAEHEAPVVISKENSTGENVDVRSCSSAPVQAPRS